MNDQARLSTPRGRGAGSNPPNRFERVVVVPDAEACADDPAPRTQFYRDASQSLISTNESPDVPFDASINPYRGCEHGCVYCYARPMHEYLGFSAGLDFETQILVKQDAPEILRKELSSRNWRPQIIGLSGATDPYQPAERRLGLTRRCLEVLLDYRNPVCIISKNHMVTRDLDILKSLAEFHCIRVAISITTLQDDLCRVMEPRTSGLDTVRELSDAGIPTSILMAPVIPGLTDHELPSIVGEAAEAGACDAGYILLRLPLAVAGLFEDWLERNFPTRKDKVLTQLRAARGGKLTDSDFKTRMRGEGLFAQQIEQMLKVARRRAGLPRDTPAISVEHFRRLSAGQMELF